VAKKVSRFQVGEVVGEKVGDTRENQVRDKK
jgi:hypothetical protein